MKPISFPQVNKVLTPPREWDEEKMGPCGDLPTYNDGVATLSLWKLDWKERFWALLRGKVWVVVISGRTQPPIGFSFAKEYFDEVEQPQGSSK